MIINTLKLHKHQKNLILTLQKYQYNLILGDIVAGLILTEEYNGYLVDIGDKKAAFLPKQETISNSQTINQLVNIQEFFILSYNAYLSQLILSTKRLKYFRVWKRIKQLINEDITIYGFVTYENFGGLLVNVDGMRGFLPNSHIVNLSYKSLMVNTSLPLKFLIADEQTNQIILSHKRAVLSLSDFTIGNIINTNITKITDYGIFVKTQNIQALLHISEIPNITSMQLRKVFEISSPLKVKIIHIDKQQGRLSVSIKKSIY